MVTLESDGPGRARTQPLASALWAVALLAAAAYIFVAHLDGPYAVFTGDALTGAGLMTVACAGVVLAWMLPRNSLGWLFLVVVPLIALAAGSADYATYAIAVRHGAVPLGQLALWVSVWAWVPALGIAFMVVPLVLPSGRLASAAWRPYLWFVAIGIGLYTVINMVAPISADASGLPSVGNPYGIGWLRPLLSPLLGIGDFLALMLILVGASSLVLRYRRGDAAERRRFAWLMIGCVPGAAYLALAFTASWVPAVAHLADLAFAPCAAALPVAIAVGLLRPRLFDAGLVVRRAAIVAGIIAALALMYAALTPVARAALSAHRAALTVLLPALAAVGVPRWRRGGRPHR